MQYQNANCWDKPRPTSASRRASTLRPTFVDGGCRPHRPVFFILSRMDPQRKASATASVSEVVGRLSNALSCRPSSNKPPRLAPASESANRLATSPSRSWRRNRVRHNPLHLLTDFRYRQALGYRKTDMTKGAVLCAIYLGSSS